MVLEFDSHVVRFYFFAKNAKKRDQLPRVPNRVGRYNSTRVDEGRKCCILQAIKIKARTVVGRGRRARYVTPDLSYYWEGESSARMIYGMKNE